MIPAISFVGYANSGKTTVISQLIRELKQRGCRIAVVKHDVHGFAMDVPGKDSWKHAEAGADIVCVSSAGRFALIEKRAVELPLNTILERIKDVDLIIVEGYKRENLPKIEVFRSESGNESLGVLPGLLAVVSDILLYPGVRHFEHDQITALADYLESAYLSD